MIHIRVITVQHLRIRAHVQQPICFVGMHLAPLYVRIYSWVVIVEVRVVQHVSHLQVIEVKVVVVLCFVDISAVIRDFPCYDTEPETVVSSEPLHLYLVSNFLVVLLGGLGKETDVTHLT